jgi:hypothetical protein
MNKKIAGIFVCILLIGVSVLSVSGDMNDEKPYLNKINPDGLFLYFARAVGSCGIAWGYANENMYTPDAYIESGTGSIFSFGAMLYREENGSYANFIRYDNNGEVLWRLHGRTFLISNWQHEGVKHTIAVMFKPQTETVAWFVPDETVFAVLAGNLSEEGNIESYLLRYNGIHKNGFNFEIVKGYAVLIIVKEENSGDIIDFPCIYLFLLEEEEGGIIIGKFNPLFVGGWSKNPSNIFGFPVDAARTFNVFFKTV